MNYSLFYRDFGFSIFLGIASIVAIIYLCQDNCKDKIWMRYFVGFLFFSIFTVSCVIYYFQDFLGIKQNRFLTTEGYIKENYYIKKYSEYFVVINDIDIEVTRKAYLDLENDRIYRITYLPNSMKAVKVEKR